MKEKILETFSNLGFKLEETDEASVYSFRYEGIYMLYMYNENDEDFLDISLPIIYTIDGNKALQACALMERINSTLKYIKAYIIEDGIWLFYERELFGDEDLETIIPRMIFRLEAALAFANKAAKEIEESMENDSAEEVTDDDSEDKENNE